MNNSIFSCKISHTIRPPLASAESDTLHRTNLGSIIEKKIFCYFFVKCSVALSRTYRPLEARAAVKLAQSWVVIPHNCEMAKFSNHKQGRDRPSLPNLLSGLDGELFLNLPDANKFSCVQHPPVV